MFFQCWPAFGDLEQVEQRVLTDVHQHIRRAGEWPTLALIAHRLGAGEGDVRAAQRCNGDLILVSSGRIGLTLKGLLLIPDGEHELRLFDRCLDSLAARRLTGATLGWSSEEIGNEPPARALRAALSWSEFGRPENPVLSFVFVPPIDRMPSCAAEWLAQLVPMASGLVPLAPDEFSREIKRYSAACSDNGCVDRRRAAWLLDEGVRHRGRVEGLRWAHKPFSEPEDCSAPAEAPTAATFAAPQARPAEVIAPRIRRTQCDEVLVTPFQVRFSPGARVCEFEAVGLARGAPNLQGLLLQWLALVKTIDISLLNPKALDAMSQNVSRLNAKLRAAAELTASGHFITLNRKRRTYEWNREVGGNLRPGEFDSAELADIARRLRTALGDDAVAAGLKRATAAR